MRILAVLVLGAMCWMIRAGEAPAEGESLFTGKEVVARVGGRTIMLDQLMEQWGPAWYEVVNKATSGRISPAEVDAQLQTAWDKALETAIKDEMFYQEALREFDQQFQKMVDAMAAGSTGAGRREAEERLKRLINKHRQEQISQITERSIKSAGGFENLARVLKNRGITFEEWKERLVRKAYTYSYLYNLFEPMGDKVEASPGKVKNFYRSHPELFTEPGKVVFKQIFFDNSTRGGEEGSYKAAASVYAAIAGGQLTFEDAVAKYSDDAPSKARGGVESGVSPEPDREAWLAEVREAAREQEPGKLGAILVSPRGCHLVILISAEKGRVVPFEVAQKQIQSKMAGDDWEKKSGELFRKLREVVSVEIAVKQFPQRYAWANVQGKQMPRRIGFGAAPSVDEAPASGGR